MADESTPKHVDKTSFLYQILEDVYHASDSCRPEIDQYRTTKSTRSQSFQSLSTNKSSQFSIRGSLAPTSLKNYHIPPAPLSARDHTPYVSRPSKTKSKSKKRPSSAHPRHIRSRAFYKNTKQIEKRCNTINEKRCRPKSAPLRKSQSTSTVNKSKSSKHTNHQRNRYRARPKSVKSPRTYSLSKMVSAHSTGTTPRHYQSATNLLFTPSTTPKTFEILKMNQHLRSQRKPKINSFTGSYLTNSSYSSTENNPLSINTDNVIPNGLSRSKWIQNYVKDRNENLYSLDEFAHLKLMDLERMNRRKISHRETANLTVDVDDEFDAVIPDVHEDQEDEHQNDQNDENSNSLNSTNQNTKTKSDSMATNQKLQSLSTNQNQQRRISPPHIHGNNLKNQVTDQSLRIAMYLDLLQMISESVPKHQDLLKFLSSELTKYVFDHQQRVSQQNKENVDTVQPYNFNGESIKFSTLCRQSTYLDAAHHYKLKYEMLLQQIEDEKREKEEQQIKQQKQQKIEKLFQRRTDHLKRYLKEWRIKVNVRKLKERSLVRMRRQSWKHWRSAYRQSRCWNFECTIDGLENELGRSEMYRELYFARNGALIQQIKQYKEALVTCANAVNRNEFCEVCMSSWHNECREYIQKLKLRHTFLSDLFS